ncbi:MAG: ABC transporter substrate-binding protein [Acidobacteriota bacterium]
MTSKEIFIGMSNALSGPTAALGTDMKSGASIYIDKVNAAGGIAGRKIRLLSLDDGYEPPRTAANTRKFVEHDKVFALFGYVGTPTSLAAVPVFSRGKIPFIAPFTGAELLRNPVNPYVFNVRASYFDETEAMVEHLVKDLGVTRIGVFAQADAYGDAGRVGVLRALQKRGIKMAGSGTYTRNTVDVDAAIAALKAAAPQAVIMIGTYKPCAVFIRKSKAAGFTPRFLNLSFVGTEALITELGPDGEGVYITQVMPNHTDVTIPIVKQFRADMQATGKTPNFTKLEGYVGAVVLVEALKRTNPLTRESLVGTLERLDFDLGGMRLIFSPQRHQGSSQVFLTRIEKGKAVSIGRMQ